MCERHLGEPSGLFVRCEIPRIELGRRLEDASLLECLLHGRVLGDLAVRETRRVAQEIVDRHRSRRRGPAVGDPRELGVGVGHAHLRRIERRAWSTIGAG
jgi:hypothetical protein